MDNGSRRSRPRQRGVVTIEFALLLVLGVLPLLLLTFSGVMIFTAKQSLALAAGEGARAALRYADHATRQTNACRASQRSMQWLLNFSAQPANCAAPNSAPIVVSAPFPCEPGAPMQCMRVDVSYDYNSHPFIPGTGRLYGWVLGDRIRSSATVQLDLGSN